MPTTARCRWMAMHTASRERPFAGQPHGEVGVTLGRDRDLFHKQENQTMRTILIAALAALFLAACGKDEPRPPTAEEQRAEALANSDKNRKLQELLEQQRSTALSNATANDNSYF